MTDSLYLRLKSLNTRTVRGVTSPKNIVRVAAMHNLREIQAELGASAASGINPARMHLNYQLRGPATADEVAGLALALMDNAGVTTLRRDACMALELVVSLPAATTINHGEYFAAAVAWADAFFAVPILSAAVHLDEAAPHCHILILPLVAGRMQGGALAGGPARIRGMLADFQRQVAQRFGLTHQPCAKRLSKPNRDAAGRMVLDALRARPERLSEPAMRDALVAALGSQAETLLALLGLKMPSTKVKARSFADIMTAPCKPERSRRAAPNTKHIDVAQNLGNQEGKKFDNVYLCVDVAPSLSPNPAHAQLLQLATDHPAGAAAQHVAGQQQAAQVEQREARTGAADQSVEGMQNSLHTSTPAGQVAPANTLLRTQAAPAPSAPGQATPTSTNTAPAKRRPAAAKSAPVAVGTGKTPDTPKAVQQLDTLTTGTNPTNFVRLVEQHQVGTSAADKDASSSGHISHGGAIPAPHAGAPGCRRSPSKTGDTPTDVGDSLETQQVDQRAAGDFHRHRDDDHPAETWCSDRGEFVQATGPPPSACHLYR